MARVRNLLIEEDGVYLLYPGGADNVSAPVRRAYAVLFCEDVSGWNIRSDVSSGRSPAGNIATHENSAFSASIADGVGAAPAFGLESQCVKYRRELITSLAERTSGTSVNCIFHRG
jgi:hypothetical protein